MVTTTNIRFSTLIDSLKNGLTSVETLHLKALNRVPVGKFIVISRLYSCHRIKFCANVIH